MYRCLKHILQENKDPGFTSAHARFYAKVTFESFTGKAVTKLFVLRMFLCANWDVIRTALPKKPPVVFYSKKP